MSDVPQPKMYNSRKFLEGYDNINWHRDKVSLDKPKEDDKILTCPECGEKFEPGQDERVDNKMKCSKCAGYC